MKWLAEILDHTRAVRFRRILLHHQLTGTVRNTAPVYATATPANLTKGIAGHSDDPRNGHCRDAQE